MMANSTRLRLSQATLAPRSSITTSPRADGLIAASAGRSIPGMVLMTILASASMAPELPADTTQSASPRATASMVSRMDESRMRSAAVPLVSLLITPGACRVVHIARAAGERASNGSSTAWSPTRSTRRPGCRSAASASPSMTMPGAPSPPIASTARAYPAVAGSLVPVESTAVIAIGRHVRIAGAATASSHIEGEPDRHAGAPPIRIQPRLRSGWLP